uniref:Uncharacterized protein n=1 Tax=Pyronema omphalodes (strain CBS 100304) TaxID=1076935 RepID=U4KU56_PYROM
MSQGNQEPRQQPNEPLQPELPSTGAKGVVDSGPRQHPSGDSNVHNDAPINRSLPVKPLGMGDNNPRQDSTAPKRSCDCNYFAVPSGSGQLAMCIEELCDCRNNGSLCGGSCGCSNESEKCTNRT